LVWHPRKQKKNLFLFLYVSDDIEFGLAPKKTKQFILFLFLYVSDDIEFGLAPKKTAFAPPLLRRSRHTPPLLCRSRHTAPPLGSNGTKGANGFKDLNGWTPTVQVGTQLIYKKVQSLFTKKSKRPGWDLIADSYDDVFYLFYFINIFWSRSVGFRLLI
jgi:hypothetical protein